MEKLRNENNSSQFSQDQFWPEKYKYRKEESWNLKYKLQNELIIWLYRANYIGVWESGWMRKEKKELEGMKS